MDQLHEPPVDAVAHFQHPVAIHRLNRFGDHGRDARQQPAVVVIERWRRSLERHGAPCGATPPDRRHDHVTAHWRVRVANETPDVMKVPIVVARKG
jgi:hypothetical protein